MLRKLSVKAFMQMHMKSNLYREKFTSSEITLRHEQIKINSVAVDRNDAETLVKAERVC